jgi:chemosensory pili system protein ChpA (sensor histidine kinase/response regulator)
MTQSALPNQAGTQSYDLAALTWVLPDLRKSLPLAISIIRQELAELKANDIAAAEHQRVIHLQDPLRLFRQARRVLEMIGQSAAAKLLIASGDTLQLFFKTPSAFTEDAIGIVERAQFAILDYLEALLKDRPAAAESLFPQYRALLDGLAGQRIHPADLWAQHWTWQEIELFLSLPVVEISPPLKAQLGKAFLGFLNTGDCTAAAELTSICANLAASTASSKKKSFALLAAGFFEACQYRLFFWDIYAERTAAQILGQLQAEMRQDEARFDNVAHDATFYCLMANIEDEKKTKFLTAVQIAYSQLARPNSDYKLPRYGRFDPAQKELLRRRLSVLSESWSSLAGGDMRLSSAVQDHMTAAAQILQKLEPESLSLVNSLWRVVALTIKLGTKPNPQLAMEVATTLLYLEAVYDDIDSATDVMGARMDSLAQRLGCVCDGEAPPAVEPWMEDLYRRLSERQSMGSVTSELRITLGAVEIALEKYLRDPLDSSILFMVSEHLSQMYGVFSVLGLQQAVNAVFKIREILGTHLSTEKRNRPIPLPIYEQIARSVSTMGFLIDTLNYQISIARELFVYDPQTFEFTYLNGRGAASKKIDLPLVDKESESFVNAKAFLPARPVEQNKPQQVYPANLLVNSGRASLPARHDEDDGKAIFDIFLEEVSSVIEDAQRALPPLDFKPEEFQDLLFFRRAFHTLKGGARMVGMESFGEAAWAFEQLMIHWLAEKKVPNTELLGLVKQALAAFSNWSLDIQRGRPTHWTEAEFRKAADAMRLEGHCLPLLQSNLQTRLDQDTQHLSAQTESQRDDWTKISSFETPPMSVRPSPDKLSPFGTTDQHTRLLRNGPADRIDTELSESHSMKFESFDEMFSIAPFVEPLTSEPSFPPIPDAFFATYVTETSDWAQSLWAHVSTWEASGSEPALCTAQDLAHSIRGNSAAVGVLAIADLAKAMELALDYLQESKQAVTSHISLFQEAAAALLEMVQASAERRVAQASPALVTSLNALQTKSVMGSPSPDELLEAHRNEETKFGPEFFIPSQLFSVPESATTSQDVTTSAVFLAQATSSLQFEQKDDPLESQDQLDYELLPVFQEEGAELLSALGKALRQWVDNPRVPVHRTNALRLLHTIKGSGRLTGAFRLGELAHRMESSIEELPLQSFSGKNLEPFLVSFDQLQSEFERLGPSSGADGAAPATEHRYPATLSPIGASTDAPSSHIHTHRPLPAMLSGLIRVRSSVVERLVDQAGEVSVYSSRTEAQLAQISNALGDLSQTLDRLSVQLRDLELQADLRIQSRNTAASDVAQQFDPLEFDRFTRHQEIVRMMAESLGDVFTVRHSVQSAISSSQENLEQQSRQLRELQRDLLRLRLVDFDVIADRLYGVVRQTAKELGKQVNLDLEAGKIELDRSVLERMTPSFEHLLRNAVVHGIETIEERGALNKPSTGAIKVVVSQEGNDVAILVSDDGRGLSVERIRRQAQSLGLISADQELDQEAAIKLLYTPGFTTAMQVTELAGRGIGLDVVLSEVNALGGRIETHFEQGRGTQFKLILPLTTAVTQVLIFRVGKVRFGIPVGLVQKVMRASPLMLESAYCDGQLSTEQGKAIQFYGSGPLLQIPQDAAVYRNKTDPVIIMRSAGQGLALHVDEVIGNREVVVKNMGAQLSRLPGLAGITVMPSGETVLIYNPIALANIYGQDVRKAQVMSLQSAAKHLPVEAQAPLILVVDDAITVRRVIQRLLEREGYRVALAKDGVDALQVLAQQRPLMVLTDIEMPRMDGFELTRSIRARAEYVDLPIVMITSRIAQKHRDHAMSLGVNHYLGKPYSEPELLSLVRDQVQAAAKRAALRQSLDV